MSFKSLEVSIENHIAHVKLNRPNELNSMNIDFWKELPVAISEIDQQAEARVIVISSTGKHFSAGMDLAVFTTPNSIPMNGDPARMAENLRRAVLQLQQAFNVLEEVRVPVLAAIQGGCIGGAVDMVSACDSRYCTEDTFFTIKETQLGMTADLGTLQRLPHLIPQGVMRELAYTGRKFDAQEAKEIGLVNKIYPSQEAMLEGVMDVAQQIAKQSPMAVAGCKEMINYSRDHSVADSLKYMATWQSGMFRPQDMMKCFGAKAQKTDPDFEPLLPIKPLFS
ncbi:crotonase/enoyl-CoA hydratase family protein [Alkalimarinus coralli]|uniref:crotonase/enoyl-CoA hydratase family protein n=1 Tax=Alkalimarinus coralli TaxID=2935863 RepID=UPI00202B964F|nr:crotonase/enoyl-CoA hydratase family protein [Alkalimarinus coralli]